MPSHAFVAFAVLVLLVVLLGAIGAWYFYAQMPVAAAGPVESRRVELDGRARHFMLVRPPGLRPHAPVLIVLHGSLMNGLQMRRLLGAGLERLAHSQGAVVVYPSGIEGHFNDGRVTASYSARKLNIDDVGFVRDIVTVLASELQIDPQRVYALGYSNGGHMAMRLSTEAPDLVAGIIVVNANVPTSDNLGWKLPEDSTTSLPPVVLIEGTKDPINPYTGGRVTIFGFGDRGTVLSAVDSARWFARRAGLAAEAVADTTQHLAGLEVQQQDWGQPSRVRLITLHGAGHTVPQRDYRFPRFLGATVLDDRILHTAWTMVDQP